MDTIDQSYIYLLFFFVIFHIQLLKNPPIVLASINVFEPDNVTQAHVLKLNSHVDPSYEHCQLLYIKVFPFSVLKLISEALIVPELLSYSTEQLSK